MLGKTIALEHILKTTSNWRACTREQEDTIQWPSRDVTVAQDRDRDWSELKELFMLSGDGVSERRPVTGCTQLKTGSACL